MSKALAAAVAALRDIDSNFDHEHHSKGSVRVGECDGPGRCRCCTAAAAIAEVEGLGTDPLEIDVQISMGRMSGNGAHNGHFRLEATDNDARIRVFELYLSPEQFADMLSNRMTTGRLTLYRSDKYGLTREHQKVILPRPKYGDVDALTASARAWEADNPGWVIQSYDLKWNGHNLHDDGYHVHADRWIP